MAVVEQQEMEWTLRQKERSWMFLYIISHESTFFMQDK